MIKCPNIPGLVSLNILQFESGDIEAAQENK